LDIIELFWIVINCELSTRIDIGYTWNHLDFEH